MGYALKPARYVEYYANVTEQNVTLLEYTSWQDTTEKTRQKYADFALRRDLHPFSFFQFNYEHKDDGAANRIIVEIYNQQDQLIFYDSPAHNAAWTSEGDVFAPYYIYGIRLLLNDEYTIYFYSDDGDTVNIKNINILGYPTPFEPSSFLPP